MKHTRIVTKVIDGHLPVMIRRQIARLMEHEPDGRAIVIEMFNVPTRRTAAQNDFFHSAIVPWAKEEGHVVEELKRDLLGSVFGWEESPLGLARVPRKPHTSTLTVEEFSELINRTVEIAAECGYLIQLPSEYNAAKWLPEELRT